MMMPPSAGVIGYAPVMGAVVTNPYSYYQVPPEYNYQASQPGAGFADPSIDDYQSKLDALKKL